MGGATERQALVAVKSITGCGAEDWSEGRLLPGDVIEQVTAVKQEVNVFASAPFKDGKYGLQRELRKIHKANETALARVKRRGTKVDLSVCVVSEEAMMRKKLYLLADPVQKNYVALLMDSTEEECVALQDQTRRLMEKLKRPGVSQQVSIKDRLISYPWQSKMHQFLPSPNSAMVFSLILMPFQRANEGGDGDLENTTARAMAWLSASQSSGVPVIFVNIQSEPMFLQSSTSKYFGSSNPEDPLGMVNSGMYPLHELEGTEINVTRAIRLWYSPPEGEIAITLQPTDGEARLGVNITCTEEGFCYVSSVDIGTAADRAGIRKIYDAACSANKLLVVSRVAGEKVTPWFVSASGAIRCFNAHSISEKISSHRQAREPIDFYFMVWTGGTNVKPASPSRARARDRPRPAENLDRSSSSLEGQMVSVTSSRYSLSSESDGKMDSFGSGEKIDGSLELAISDDLAVERTSSTRSFNFQDDVPSLGKNKGDKLTTNEEFTFNATG
ncbi:uncharacterized protein LOC9630103 [Selaginella moellendorffii]|uniref:uncharacterized protein LOC9630103 n=1 Tax=Selaginella moellendorffii TaxID=88036 RepID=UPI000D1D009F|nr:uncharacterized protein LOC9630103 [Selaginella moellendorffii]|eukprot:XP_024539456.1 uncharacterized protein LOC9630103 [Selaginella moellendorffii]